MYPKTEPGLTPDMARKLLPADAPDSSAKMGQLLLDTLEEDGDLRPEYRKKLFLRPIPSLEGVFSRLQLLRAAKERRSCMEILIEEWTKLTKSVVEEDFLDEDDVSRKRHEVFFLYLPDSYATYRERVVEFDNTATLLLAKCGFYSLYSGYAYDALLKLILSCGDSKGLFQFIWQVKTGTYDPDNITEI